MSIATSEKTDLRREWLASVMVTATAGCILLTFLGNLVFFSVPFGLAYPFATAAIMLIAYKILGKGELDTQLPEHLRIQQGVVIGGLLSVALAFTVSGKPSVRDLLVAGTATGALAVLSIAWESFIIHRERRAAQKAGVDAEEARRLASDGHLGAAQENLTDALLATEKAYGSNHPQVATIVTYLAEVCAALGQNAACTLMYQRAAAIHEAMLPWSDDLIAAQMRFAQHLRKLGRFEEALPVATRAAGISRRLYGNTALTGSCLIEVARNQSALGRLQEAYKTTGEAAEMLESTYGRDHRECMLARGLVASLCLRLGRMAEAERLLRDPVLQRESKAEREPDVEYLDLLLDLSVVLRRENPPAADETFQKALEVFRAWVGPKYERTPEMLELMPAYLAPDEGALHRFYTELCTTESFGTRQVLREHPEIARQVDRSGWTPLQWTAFLGSADLVSDLVARGADLEHGRGRDYPAMYVAARWGRHRALAALLRSGVEIDIDVDTLDASRPLHGAVRSGDQSTFDILVSHKASVHSTNTKGWTALHEAAYLGERKFLVRLLSEGADVDFQAPPHYDSPLHAAVKGGSWVTAETLILNLAKDSLADAEGLLPLQQAGRLGRAETMRVLQSHASPAALNLMAKDSTVG